MTQFIFVVRRKDETSLEIGSEITDRNICKRWMCLTMK